MESYNSDEVLSNMDGVCWHRTNSIWYGQTDSSSKRKHGRQALNNDVAVGSVNGVVIDRTEVLF